MDIQRKAFESSNNVNPDWSFKFDEELQQYVATDFEMTNQVDEFNEHWDTFRAGWQAAKAQAVPAKLVLELEKGRFKEYEFKALLRQSLRASKVTRPKLNWVHVMSMLGTGSTVAHRICEALGVNPDGTEFKAQEPAND